METEESKGKRLIKNTVIYTISNFGSKILSFLIVPLYTYYLTTEEFGTYDNIVAFISLFAPLSVLAIHEGLLRWLLKSEESHDDIICSGFTMHLLFTVVFDLVLFVVFRFWAWEYDWLFMLLLTTNSLHTTLQFTARGEQKNKVFAISGVVYTMVMLACNLFFVILKRMGVVGMLWSLIIGHVAAILFLMVGMGRALFGVRCHFNKALAKTMLVYSVLLVPNNVSWWVMNASCRVILTNFVGSSANGIYSLANKFPSVITILHSLFYQAWQEQAVLEYDSESRDAYYTQVFRTYMKIACSAVLLLIPFTKFVIVHFMNESYLSAYQYVGLLYIGTLFSSFSGFFGTGYISAKDTRHAMTTTMIGAACNIALMVALVKPLGVWAACIATMSSNVIVWIIRAVQTKKYFSIRVDWKSFAVFMSGIAIFSALVCFSDDVLTVAMFCVGGIIALIYNRDILRAVFTRRQRKGGTHE